MQYIGYPKHRGLKRYYRGLNRIDAWHVSRFDFNDPKPYRESQDCHFDRKGYGNQSFRRRKPHLDRLFNHFELFAEKCRETTTPFQLYAVLLNDHSASDALFFHKPSVNNEQFLFKVSDLSTETTLTNDNLNEYLDQLVGYQKSYGIAGEPFCLITKENVGRPFL